MPFSVNFEKFQLKIGLSRLGFAVCKLTNSRKRTSAEGSQNERDSACVYIKTANFRSCEIISDEYSGTISFLNLRSDIYALSYRDYATIRACIKKL